MKSLTAIRQFVDDETTMVSFRMPIQLHDVLVEQAESRGLSLTQLMVAVLDGAALDLGAVPKPKKKIKGKKKS